MILNIDNYEILNFYGYTSVIKQDDRIYDVSSLGSKSTELIRYEKLNKFYNKVIDKAKKQIGKSNSLYYILDDNKCVFKLKHVKSGNIIYIGKYDFEISIGLNCHQRFGHSYDFITNTETYKTEEL